MKDPRIEQVLDSNPNVAWEYQASVPLRQISKVKSHANQARIDRPVDAELVRQYKESLIAGDEFPALVLFPDGDEFIVSDGNHRVEAKRAAGRSTTDAYVVVTDSPVDRDLLTFEWNLLNGKMSTDEDRDRHAIYLIQRGLVKADVAARLHMNRKRLEEVLAEDEGHTRAMGLGVKSPWAKLPSRYAKVRLHKDVTLDTVFAAAVKFAARFSLKTPQVKAFAAELKALRSEQEGLDLIAKYTKGFLAEIEKQRREALAGRRRSNNPGQNPYVLFNAHLAYIFKAVGNEFNKLVVSGLTDEEKQAFRSKLANARAVLADAQDVIDNAAVTSG